MEEWKRRYGYEVNFNEWPRAWYVSSNGYIMTSKNAFDGDLAIPKLVTK